MSILVSNMRLTRAAEAICSRVLADMPVIWVYKHLT